jgi:hypothetical protein
MSFEPKRISQLDSIPSLALDDLVPVVDVSDTTDGVVGKTKKSTISLFLSSLLSFGNVTTQGNTFNGASQLVQLNGSTQLPAVSGALLTNLNASNISSGTIADARLSANVTVQGNTFNGASQLVQLNGSTQLPAVSGVNLTNLNASNIASGTIADARLSANVTVQGNTFNLPNKLVQLDASLQLPGVNGSNLANLNASNITAGTLPDGRLSSNVMFKTKIVTNISTSGTTILTNALTDYWFVTTHTSGNAIFSLSDAPAITAGTYFRILANSNQNVHILAGPSTTIYYFMGTVSPGSSFTPAAQRGRVIDLYCVANNTFIMTGDLM